MSAAAHRFSADLRDTAEYARPVLGIEAGVAAKAADVLGAVYPGRAARILFDDEELLLFQIVEEADVVGGDEELCVMGIGFPGAKPATPPCFYLYPSRIHFGTLCRRLNPHGHSSRYSREMFRTGIRKRRGAGHGRRTAGPSATPAPRAVPERTPG